MNIRVLLFTAGIAGVQVLSAIELTADSNRLEVGEAFVKMLVEYQEPGRAGTKCRWDFPRNANPFGGTSRGIFYSGQFPYGYSLWSRGA